MSSMFHHFFISSLSLDQIPFMMILYLNSFFLIVDHLIEMCYLSLCLLQCFSQGASLCSNSKVSSLGRLRSLFFFLTQDPFFFLPLFCGISQIDFLFDSLFFFNIIYLFFLLNILKVILNHISIFWEMILGHQKK